MCVCVCVCRVPVCTEPFFVVCAGGVAIGSVADLYVEPAGALGVGAFAAVVSVLGYKYLTPFLERRIGLKDTCGVHNLHGMPGVIAAIVSAIVTAVCHSTRCTYIALDYSP